MTLSLRTVALSLSLFVSTSNAAAQGADPNAAVRTEIVTTEALLPNLADRAAAQYVLATDYAALGDSAKTLALLKQAVESDEGFDPSADRAFASFKTNPEFQALVKRAAQKFPAVHRAQLAFTIAEKDLIPEGLASNPSGDPFYLGSLNRRKIVQIHDGNATDFIPTDRYNLLPVLGMKVDPEDRSLWANTGADSTAKSELVHFDVTGKLLGRWSPPGDGKHLLNDLVLRNNREIFLTDSLANQAFRFDRATHAFTPLQLSRPLYYPNGIAMSASGDLVFIADAFGVLRYNPKEGTSSEVIPGKGATLAGVDGMYWDRGWLVAVQNGIGLPRIARLQLSADSAHVTKSEILEYRSDFVELPTTGAIAKGKFYFICNSQLDNLRDEKIVDPSKLQPVRIGVVSLE
jgi:hypothetical protein